MSKKIEVRSILTIKPSPSLWEWSHVMDNHTRHSIGNAPWPGFSREPRVSFSIAHTMDAIFLKFYVNERAPRITFHNPNDPVYKDTCVEFFISFDPGRSYYNLEFNAIGTCLMAYGDGREERSYLPPALIQTIGRYSSLRSSSSNAGSVGSFASDDSVGSFASGDSSLPSSSSSDNSVDWSLTLKIPLKVFIHDTINSLSGIRAKANFYKCGDECPAPHYLTWNDIVTPGPDFHQPAFFGELLFR